LSSLPKKLESQTTKQLYAKEKLLEIPDTEFERWLQQWQEQWHKCVCDEGAYFEGY